MIVTLANHKRKYLLRQYTNTHFFLQLLPLDLKQNDIVVIKKPNRK